VARQVGADLRLLEHVHGVHPGGAGGLECLHGAAGEAAHRELGGALHEEDDGVAFDFGLDALQHRHGGRTRWGIQSPILKRSRGARPRVPPSALTRRIPPWRSNFLPSRTTAPPSSRTCRPRRSTSTTASTTRRTWTTSTR